MINTLKHSMRCLVVQILALLSVSVFAQEQQRMRSTMVGVGANNVLDTYLSPFNYTGLDIRIMHETLRQTKQLEGRLYHQSLLDVDGGYLTNKSKSAHEYVFGVRYSYAWLYNICNDNPNSNPNSNSNPNLNSNPNPNRLTILTGLQPSVYLGGIYNTRNGNNPAQAKANFMLNATAIATYNVHIFKKVFPISYQLTVPLVGIAYSPNYGQSYYEEFGLGNYDHNICFAHIANMPTMRHLLTVDIPIRNNYLRVGWSGQFNQAKLNGLKYHSYSNDFMIGFTKMY